MGTGSVSVSEKEYYLLYLIKQIEKLYLSKRYSKEKEFISNDNNLIIKILYFEFDEGYLIKDQTKSKYFILRKIRTNQLELSKIINTIEKLELLTSDRFFKLYHYLIRNDLDNHGKLVYILFEGGSNPMKQLNMKNNDLTYNEKMMIFINILFCLKILEINKIQKENFIPENIYYSGQENNSQKIELKLLGYINIIDNIYLEKTNTHNFFAPEEKPKMISNIEPLVLVLDLYKLLFNDKLNINKKDIVNLNYEFIYKEIEIKLKNISENIKNAKKYDDNFIIFFIKVISKRLTLDKLLHEKFVVNTLKNNNYFYKLIKENIIEIGFDNLEDNKNMKSN